MSVPSADVRTLPGLLRHAAHTSPERGIGHVQADGTIDRRAYPSLLNTARRVAGGLHATSPPDTSVLLPIESNDTFLPAFWGTLLSDRVPVPLPAPSRPGDTAHERFRAVRTQLDAPVVLTPTPDGPGLDAVADEQILALDALRTASPLDERPTPTPDDLAVLQFSSGSTGAPKGIRLTHRNVLANARAIANGLRMDETDVGSNWMPLFHDMGLIGYHLVPLLVGIPQYHLATADFLRNPFRWLSHLTAQPVTITAAPNFGQELVLRHLERRTPDADWTLSSVRLLLNGAEPIAPSVMERFMEALAPHGLAPEAMHPVYGLAEGTLAVTMPAVPDAPRTAVLDRPTLQEERRAVPAESSEGLRYASEGSPVSSCEVRVADEDDQPLPERHVGHVQIRGASVTEGYHRAPEATAGAFTDDGWLRTGDLGFSHDGHLYVTGRAKDVLFVHGRNLHAHDLERAVVNAVPAARTGKVAICGRSTKEGEQVLLFMAGHPSAEMAERFVTARQALRRRFGLSPDVMVPLPSTEIPRTTSGKLQRYKLRAAYAEGRFDERIQTMSALVDQAADGHDAERVAPRNYRETILHRIWCEELGHPPEAVGVHDHFVEDLGGTSVQATSILGRLETEHRLQIPSSVLDERGTIARLAAYLDEHAVRARSSGPRSKFGG